MVPFCTASDGGGSTRTPASFCGLVGLKPSFGRIPAYDIARYAQTGVRGALTTTVSDTARLLDVMVGPSRDDRTSLPAPGIRYEDVTETLDVRGLRVAWSADLGFAVVDPEVVALYEQAADALIDAAELRRVDRAVGWPDPVRIWTKLEGVDRWIELPDGLYPDRADELDQLARPGWDSAARATLPKFGRVLTDRKQLESEIAAVFDDVDVLITPATATPAFAAEGPMPTEICGRRVHAGMTVIFPMFANIWGSPAICVPAGRTRDGLPVGLQIMADRHRDDVCLRLARILEQAQPWPRHAPTAAR
jgi:Asp-tRNA(Asn)/Glu-tRNA(Gln) amidotransferase A subunit family amidase